ncbi:MAG: hypothetical protein H5U19_02865 [Rhodobacteraceae bacterium]|nr:hypothetical protein [Paracoccaceae bacterium]
MLKTVSAAMTTDVVMADPPEDARTVWEQVRTAGVANVPVGTGAERRLLLSIWRDTTSD